MNERETVSVSYIEELSIKEIRNGRAVGTRRERTERGRASEINIHRR